MQNKIKIFLLFFLLLTFFVPSFTQAFSDQCTSGGPWWVNGYSQSPVEMVTGVSSQFSVSATVNPGSQTVYRLDGWIEYGDGTQDGCYSDTVMNCDSGNVYHTYGSAGTYTVTTHAAIANGGAGVSCQSSRPLIVRDPVTQPDLGTICAASNIPTRWSFFGPNGEVPYSGGNSFCIDDVVGNWSIGNIPAVSGYDGPFLSPSTATQTVGREGAISWNITYTPTTTGGPINGSCGSAATSYPPSATGFSGSLCSSGIASPASPAFPGQGGGVGWQCLGSNGGSTASCSADHQSVVVTTADNSAYISQTIPLRMTPGQTYPVSIVMKNTGTSNWTVASAYALGSQNPQDNTTWFGGRVGVPGTISPNNNSTFNFYVTAPSTPGTYNFQTRMIHDLSNGSIPAQWFGEYTPNLSIAVQQLASPTNLVLSCPSPGNTLTASWTNPAGYNTYFLRANPGGNNYTWPSAVQVPENGQSGSGNSYSFATVPGQTYYVWVHTRDPITGEGSATNIGGNVVCSGPAEVDGATFVSQNVPTRLDPGASTNVSVTMQNSGTSTWLPSSNYGLGTQNPGDNTIFGSSRHYVTSSVAPGSSYTFNYTLTCPTTPGTYYFQNKMVHDLANGAIPPNWFGALTPNTPIQCQPVPQPTNLSVVCPTPGTTVYANWTAPSGYNSYFIRVNQGVNNGGSPVWISVPENGQSGIGNSYTFNTTPGQAYYIWIHTRDPATGEYSGAVAANVKCAPPPPTNLTLSCPSPGTAVNASWSNPGGYSTFIIRANQGVNNNTFPSAIRDDNYTGTTYTFPATPGQTYFYWMHTLDNVTGDYSAAVTGNVSCINTSINGQCGSANGKNYGSAVTTYAPDVQCNSGTASNTTFPSNGSSVTWTCSGQNGGSSSPQCSASRSSTPVNGTCGTADGKIYTSSATGYSPDTQCVNGSPSSTLFPAPGSTQNWTCSGQNGGSPASCSASRSLSAIDGTCGTADGKTYLSTDTTYSPYTQCTNGAPSTSAFPSVGSTQNWTCSGQNGGSPSAQCSANRQSGTSAIDGTCGTADGKTYPSSRTTYSPDTQCTNGAPSTTAFPLAGFSQNWTCSGQNGGSPSSQCSAARSTASSNSGPSAPTVSCTNCGGTSANPTGFTGTNYNFNFNCTDPDGDQVAYAVDWDLDSVVDALYPSSGYVNSGTSQNGIYSWSSSGTKSIGVIAFDSNGNWSPWVVKDVAVSNSQVNGTCGSANRAYSSSDTSYSGDTYCSSGSVSGCSSGSTPNCSFPAAGSSVSWTCLGAFGGASSSCQADRAAELKLVNIVVSNLSGGTVTGPGINCGATCSASYTLDSTITLIASPTSAYWRFDGWGGDCASFGKAKTCTLNVDGDKSVTAGFSPRVFDYNEF